MADHLPIPEIAVVAAAEAFAEGTGDEFLHVGAAEDAVREALRVMGARVEETRYTDVSGWLAPNGLGPDEHARRLVTTWESIPPRGRGVDLLLPIEECITPVPVMAAPELVTEMVAHALDDDPAECCGLVAYRDGIAERTLRMRNTKPSMAYFEMDPAELTTAVLGLEAEGLELGAIYHSHPSVPAYPSWTDVRYAANWPGIEWIIVSLADDLPAVRSYLIDDVRERPPWNTKNTA